MHGSLAEWDRTILDTGVRIVLVFADSSTSTQKIVLQQVHRAEAFVTDSGECGIVIDVLMLQFANQHVFQRLLVLPEQVALG